MTLETLLQRATRPHERAKTYAECELHHNLGSPSGWSQHRQGVSTAYNPDSYAHAGTALQPLDFPYYKVPLQDLEVFSANPSEGMCQFLSIDGASAGGRKVVLHPNALTHWSLARAPDGSVPAYTTVTTRTVVTDGMDGEHAVSNTFFLKLDYPGVIGRCPRRLDRAQLATSTFYSRMFDAWAAAGLFPNAVGYFPESIGLLWKLSGADEAVGMIGREFVPRPHVNDRRICIPFFALYPKDSTAPDDDALLTQLLRMQSSPEDGFLHITELIFGAIGALFTKRDTPDSTTPAKWRILHDAHAQNLLLELDAEGKPRRVIFRDFAHMYGLVLNDADNVDYLKAANPSGKVLDSRTEPDYMSRKASHLIDAKLGRYVVHPLVEEFCRSFGCRRPNLLARIRHQFRTMLPELNDLLPRSRWYRRTDGMEYDDNGRILLQQGEGAPLLRESQ